MAARIGTACIIEHCSDVAGIAAGTVSAGAAFLARLLQFMETPQYLRR
jgi:predicted SPOUT superfamily RNA methylase MTH1